MGPSVYLPARRVSSSSGRWPDDGAPQPAHGIPLIRAMLRLAAVARRVMLGGISAVVMLGIIMLGVLTLGGTPVCAVEPPQQADQSSDDASKAVKQPATWTEQLDQLIAAHPGEAAVAVRNLATGASYLHRADEPFPTASLVKFPVMIEAYRQAQAGKLRLTSAVTLRDEDKVPGSGILTTHFSAGASFSLRDAIRMMIAWSDNTATNLVVDQIGLPATTAAMRELGCPETRLHAKVFRRDTSIDPARSQKFGLGSTTAAEMLGLLERLERRELVDRESSEAMLGHLLACQDRETSPRFLPPRVQVAHKTGSVTGVRTDAGLIRTPGGVIAFCVLTRNNRRMERTAGDAQTESGGEPGALLCARVARTAYDHFNPPGTKRAEGDAEFPTLRLGDSGDSVERLQRALNRALEPSPELDVDGEFGPQTQAAVVRFQKSRQLDATGIVDRGLWNLLNQAR